MFSRLGSSCDPVVTVVISCPVNEKTTRQGGFSKVQQTGKFLNRGNRVYKTAATKFVLLV